MASYDYLGVTGLVGIDYEEPDACMELFGATSGTYPDLDRFNRTTSWQWTQYAVSNVNFYDVDYTYDQTSNIIVAEDNVHSGFDVCYTLDDLNRLTRAEEGTWNGSAITNCTRDQQWTLDHAGNWETVKLDLNGDGDFLDTDELDETRTHNKANEILTRDTDSQTPVEYTLSHDSAGNLSDDAELREFEYDAFNRLCIAKDQSGNTVAEYRYNGVGQLIAEHKDTDSDGDVDGNDLWYHFLCDEKSRLVSAYRDTDSSPKEEFCFHESGLGEAQSRNNNVICRNKDANTTWTAASDGTLEQRYYYCQNARNDVSALIDDSGVIMESAKYSAYGVPCGIPGGDVDGDFDCDGDDATEIQNLIDTSGYDVIADMDLDGDVDSTDKSIAEDTEHGNKDLGRGELSSHGNRIGCAGYHADETLGMAYHVQRRSLESTLGRWNQRDPAEFIDGVNAYEYVASRPIIMIDPSGMFLIPMHALLTQTECQQAGLLGCDNVCNQLAFNSSVYADSPQFQTVENAPRHCMVPWTVYYYGPFDPVTSIQHIVLGHQIMQSWRQEQLNRIFSCFASGSCSCASFLRGIGVLIHHYQDCQARAHTDANGTPRGWHPQDLAAHLQMDLTPSPLEFQNASQVTRDLLNGFRALIIAKCCSLEFALWCPTDSDSGGF